MSLFSPVILQASFTQTPMKELSKYKDKMNVEIKCFVPCCHVAVLSRDFAGILHTDSDDAPQSFLSFSVAQYKDRYSVSKRNQITPTI